MGRELVVRITIAALVFCIIAYQAVLNKCDAKNEKVVSPPLEQPSTHAHTTATLLKDESSSSSSSSSSPSAAAAFFKDCEYIYLDLGTNRAVQIQKLFMPQCFPDAPILPWFDSHFGDPSMRTVPGYPLCAVGFEPNPLHTQALRAVESTLVSRGHKVKINTETALGGAAGTAEIWAHWNPIHSGGASIEPESRSARFVKANVTSVPVINIGELLRDIVTQSTIQGGPVILAKLDVEGTEYKALASMLLKGSFCSIKSIMIEWHRPPPNFADNFKSIISQNPGDCNTTVAELDDETYGFGSTLPGCDITAGTR